ncbi:DEAD/DEAH box helicase [Aciduricibacillus chroicocephali]|uniref:DEAD/DEAH box helicase n=1 Tax=Aciduricibacillus chroicocephali TaxID=3054939 RepID=A0ABY9KWN6_9BACI|nr:DEAD/DEAH box helicase [Bacillaceae bacterium 44XB]
MDQFIEKLKENLNHGFIDRNRYTHGKYEPRLLVNNEKKGESVLLPILEELQTCRSFLFSVAFITESGLATLKTQLLELAEKGIHGRILTSTYLSFNKPKVFKELLKLENAEVRLTDLEGFHSKGYIFEQDRFYTLIVGSSNLSAHALKVHHEWNVKLTTHENGDIVHHFRDQFEEVWSDAKPLTESWIHAYEEIYEEQQPMQVREFPTDYNTAKRAIEIEPNKMQEVALKEIAAVREAGHKKGLIISATGTGKTYLSAFDVRSYRPKRMLFIVHREQILNKAKDDYQKVLGGPDRDYGILSGSSRETDAKYVFATIQTLTKESTLALFSKEAFDYILIDEVHKAGAASYQRVIDYFTPAFLMGMTATPERTDDFNIYELFDYNIAYEIRLQEALEEDMLAPFHYFGVTDLDFAGETTEDATVLARLVTEERVNHLIEKLNYYGYAGETLHGLMFCSRKEEAIRLSKALNEKGLRTAPLTGDHSQLEREQCVNQLESGLLDYILTVDIFNEGIDIPCVNQVVMLRQTQSSIIFIQQLGRGLRKNPGKDYVTVIDFIGNYKTNYLIPVALAGDNSQNKDNIRRHTQDTSFIKGVSTINFEPIAKKRIFESISSSNLTDLRILREAYQNLKNRLGLTPQLIDFIDQHSIDPLVITDKYGNYYQFLLKVESELPALTEYEEQVLTMLSTEVLNGKRKHEIVLLQVLLNQGPVSKRDLVDKLEEVNCRTDEGTIKSMERVLDLTFFKQSDQKKYGNLPIVTFNQDTYTWNERLQERLYENPYFYKHVQDLIDTAERKSGKYNCSQELSLHEKYSRKDVCKLLNWEQDESSTMYGYKPKHGTCPIFITYHKHEDTESSINYEDELLSPSTLKWFTRSNRTINSGEVQKIIHAEQEGYDIHIFVKKDDDEGRDFYYLGRALPDSQSVKQEEMNDKKGKQLPVVTMNMMMEKPVEHKLYHYLIEA